VLYDARDTGVAVVTLNRPDRLNAWGGSLASEFYRCMDRAEADPSVRVIVLTGSGRAFCAGADMGDGASIGGASIGEGDTDVTVLVGERHPHFVTGLRKPIIAAINGACAGIGLTQALMCDVRFAAAGAKFTTAFSRRGLIAEYGISWILPRVVGHGVALDLLLSGRTFRAEEAAQIGLVKEVVALEELMTRAVGYAEDLAVNCAQFDGGDQAPGLRRRATRTRRRQCGHRETHARIDGSPGLHRGHHGLLREASTELPAAW
jgi:enoyl-CoA hydratase/carnithine racemase